MRGLILVMFLAAATLSAASPDIAPPPDGAALLAALPLEFEPNQGQVESPAAYLARARSMDILLEGPGITAAPARGATSPVRIELRGASPEANWRAEQPLAGYSNYIRGADAEPWRTRIPHFARARLAGAYPGIDLVVYGRQGQIEFDFEVQPGADPSVIRFGVTGAQATMLDESGDLLIRTAEGEIRQRLPVVFQPGADGPSPVEGAYALVDKDSYGFRLGAYDETLPLVIDPVLSYGTYIGGEGIDAANDVAVDFLGNAYITGTTESRDFPATPGAYKGAHAGGYMPEDVFVTKLNAAGTAVVYSTFIGGGRADMGEAIDADGDGAVYVAGVTFSRDFPVTAGALQPTHKDPTSDQRGDAFVLKLSPDGTALVYSTFLGGSEGDTVEALAVDAAGNAHVTGATYSDDFPTTIGVHQPAHCAGFGYDSYLAKVRPDGSGLAFSTYVCGSWHDIAHDVAVDPSGVVYVTGQTDSPDFPVTAAGLGGGPLGGANDAFLNAYNPDGTLVWSALLGGAGDDVGRAVAVSPLGTVNVAGSTSSVDLPVTAGVFQREQADWGQTDDVFLAGITPGVIKLAYLGYFGGSRQDVPTGLAVDKSGNLYIAGRTTSADLPTTSSACLTGYRGGWDAFVTKLKKDATGLEYSMFLGGGDRDEARGIDVDSSGNAYVAGVSFSDNLPTTDAAWRPAYKAGFRGIADGFAAKVTPEPAPAERCIAINGVLNNGSMRPGPLAPGEIITIFGAGLGPTPYVLFDLAGSDRIPTRVGGTRVLFDRTEAPVIFSSHNQVAAIVPYSVATLTETEVMAEYNGIRTQGVKVGVAEASPAILTQNSSGAGPGAILNQDFSRNTAATPAAPGSVIMIYATGEGQTNPPGQDGLLALTATLPAPELQVRVLFGATEATVLYAGAAPGYTAGLLQVNAVVPSNIAPSDSVPITLMVGEWRSPPGVTVAVR